MESDNLAVVKLTPQVFLSIAFRNFGKFLTAFPAFLVLVKSACGKFEVLSRRLAVSSTSFEVLQDVFGSVMLARNCCHIFPEIFWSVLFALGCYEKSVQDFKNLPQNFLIIHYNITGQYSRAGEHAQFKLFGEHFRLKNRVC